MLKRPLQNNAAAAKRFRAAIDESTDDLLCPITQALPLDPVFAEDGKVYERTAIEAWLSQQQRSPVTNLAMGTKVFAATQIKSLIERMVKSDALPEDKVSAWKARIEEQAEVDQARRAADAGDASVALKLAAWLQKGQKGLAKDAAKAFSYIAKAAEAGNATAMGRLSSRYFADVGAKQNYALALRWAAAAVALGDALGMEVLAHLYGGGLAGLPVDKGKEFELLVSAQRLDGLSSCGLWKLALLYEEGQGTAVDMAMAEAMMRKAIMRHDTQIAVERARAWLASRGLPLDVEPVDLSSE